jgi:hypothetical protein
MFGHITASTVGTFVGCAVLLGLASWGAYLIHEEDNEDFANSANKVLISMAIICPVLFVCVFPSFWSTTLAQQPKERMTELMGDSIYLAGLTENWPLAFPLCNVLCGFCIFVQFTLLCMLNDVDKDLQFTPRDEILVGLAPFAVALQSLHLLKDFVISIKLLRQAGILNALPMSRRARFAMVGLVKGALLAGALSGTVLAHTTNNNLVLSAVASIMVVHLDAAVLEAFEKLAPQAIQDMKKEADSDGRSGRDKSLKELYAIQESTTGSLVQDIVRDSYHEMGTDNDSDLSMDSNTGWSMGGRG